MRIARSSARSVLGVDRGTWRPGGWRSVATLAVVLLAVAGLSIGPAGAMSGTFIGGLTTRTTVASTVPGNGDVNPYGVVVVNRSMGRLHRGSVLVSNFNDKTNAQGTGTTIVEISPAGHLSVFAHVEAKHLPGACPGGVGLTTALALLRGGWVVVGSLPTVKGSSATAQAGCLLVLDADGRVVETWSGGPINGPWDMTAVDQGRDALLFVTNVLNGTVAANGGTVDQGTVLRISVDLDRDRLPRIRSMTVIGTGFAERTDPAALVVGPTGVGLGAHDTLYVADTVNSRLAAIPDASDRFFPIGGGGATVSSGGALNGPLGVAIAPNGNVLSVNANDGNLVETTPGGMQVGTLALDSSGSPPGAGALFGLAVDPDGHGLWFVDDADNTLNLEH